MIVQLGPRASAPIVPHCQSPHFGYKLTQLCSIVIVDCLIAYNYIQHVHFADVGLLPHCLYLTWCFEVQQSLFQQLIFDIIQGKKRGIISLVLFLFCSLQAFFVQGSLFDMQKNSFLLSIYHQHKIMLQVCFKTINLELAIHQHYIVS